MYTLVIRRITRQSQNNLNWPTSRSQIILIVLNLLNKVKVSYLVMCQALFLTSAYLVCSVSRFIETILAPHQCWRDRSITTVELRRRQNLDRIIGSDHRTGSSDRIIGLDHRTGSSDRIIGSRKNNTRKKKT